MRKKNKEWIEERTEVQYDIGITDKNTIWEKIWKKLVKQNEPQNALKDETDEY